MTPLAQTDAAAPPLADDAATGERGELLYRKLLWVTLFRLVEVTVLLGATALWEWRSESRDGISLYWVIGATYVGSLGFALLLRQRRWLVPMAFGSVATDVAIAAAVVQLTGQGESVFIFLFLLAIVSGGVLLYRTGALWATTLAITSYVPIYATGPSSGRLVVVFVHAGAFIATGALSSYLAEQLRRTGQRLEEREGDLATITALHESIVQSLGSGLLTMSPAGAITFVNRAGEHITGLSLDRILGDPAERWFPTFGPVVGRNEGEFVRSSGDRLMLGYTRFPLIAAGDRPIGSAVVFQDLTALRAMELEVQRSQRLADLGRIAAGLAHELRNPLASMGGSIELLRDAPGVREADARLMDIVVREAARLEKLVAAFLAFSRPTPPHRADVELDRIVAEALDVYANDPVAARVQVERDLAPGIHAWCDPDQVRQVLWNLLANAAQAASAGGRAGTVRVGCSTDATHAVLFVEDDGPGMNAAELKQLFTPFFTTKEGGTGLGLATVQRLVDAQHGKVSVDSVPGRGTRFTVHLPAARPWGPG